MSKDEQDIEMTDADRPETKSAKRKKTFKHTTLSQFTIRDAAWSYIHLSLVLEPGSTNSTLDALTAQIQLQAALKSFLGLHGTAIPFDFLKIQGQDIWLRVPRGDASAVIAATGGWIGKGGEAWRLNNSSCWGPHIGRNAGMDLFDE